MFQSWCYHSVFEACNVTGRAATRLLASVACNVVLFLYVAIKQWAEGELTVPFCSLFCIGFDICVCRAGAESKHRQESLCGLHASGLFWISAVGACVYMHVGFTEQFHFVSFPSDCPQSVTFMWNTRFCIILYMSIILWEILKSLVSMAGYSSMQKIYNNI